MSAVSPQLRGFLETHIPLIEKELFSFLPVQEPEAFMYGPMRDYPERGGKRSRPALVLLSCATFGGDVNKALRTAAAFEMFQSFALLHDDIEDEDAERYGEKTLHEEHGLAVALNVGDLLIGEGYRLIGEGVGDLMAFDAAHEAIVVAWEGGVVRGHRTPTSEMDLHRQVMLKRPDLGAIVHSHSPWASVCACAHRSIPVLVDDMAEVIGGQVQCAAYAPAGRSRARAQNRTRFTRRSWRG